MTDRQIDNRIMKLRNYESQIELLEREAERIKSELKAELENAGQDERKTSKYTVRWKEIISTRLDSTALKQALPDVFKAYSKQSISKRFTVA